MARRWPLRLRNLQTLAELGLEKNTTVMFPSPMMSAIGQISSFRTRETTAAQGITPRRQQPNHRHYRRPLTTNGEAATNGEPANGAGSHIRVVLDRRWKGKGWLFYVPVALFGRQMFRRNLQKTLNVIRSKP